MNLLIDYVDEKVVELLKYSAKRKHIAFDNLVRELLTNEASVEYERQQIEDAKTC